MSACTVDPTRSLSQRMDAAKNLLSHLRDVAAGDEDFLSDLVEGETDIFDIIAKVDQSELEDQTEIAGLEVTIGLLKCRKDRAEKRAEIKRTLIATALEQIGLKKHRTPLGTISVSPKTPVAMVTEESDIPTKFWKAQAPTLDKKALNEALRARQAALEEASSLLVEEERQAALEAAKAAFPEISGATLSNGGFKLSIRR